MIQNLTELLQKYGEQVALQWAKHLHENVSDHYAARPFEELLTTTSQSSRANFDAIVYGDYSKVDAFIAKICDLRLEGGFALSEVQKAFEIYRQILVPILVKELKGDTLLEALQRLNDCLSRTIFAFSDYFLHMTNARLIEKQKKLDEDLQAAAGIQQSLLPQKLAKQPKFENLDIAWKFMPCETIGGDIFNVIRLDEDHLGFYMIDVSGHGVPPALVTFSISQTLQPHMGYTIRKRPGLSPNYEIVPPGEVLKALDSEYPWERFEKFLTIIYLILNIRNGHLIYSNAAHPPPILVHADGTTELLETGGTIIGLDGILPFEEEEKIISAGDKIILYTDGVFEFTNEKMALFGKERFHALVDSKNGLPIANILEEIVLEIQRFVGSAKLQDDVSILGIEFKERNATTQHSPQINLTIKD
ncbi:serine/threonine protein phosphatase [Desulfococcus multivorans]|uniref:Serine phosphatase n=2 Tax=Desulfococcus multivorans TaxID=897 RepID=S7UUT8_DESML|nr:serine phosphatase regulator of sigma subunit [Desulfococcus multivorans]AQV03061.1 serine/threonine protein phosphatase [Desulfococcus multivorans]EPR37844.1 serine phosphatase [Desulfococcus multivorans DSM 2059]SKA17032.1 Serine phosphatase RsbU, regulator of sigma subunit [Desulfococcus multivorans DSM 2059]